MSHQCTDIQTDVIEFLSASVSFCVFCLLDFAYSHLFLYFSLPSTEFADNYSFNYSSKSYVIFAVLVVVLVVVDVIAVFLFVLFCFLVVVVFC